MNDEYVLRFSKRQVRRTILSFLVRKMGKGYPIALVLLIATLAFQLSEGDRSWFVGVLATIILLGIVLPTAAVVTHLRIGMRKLADMPDGTATMSITDTGLAVRSGNAAADIPWKTITEGWVYPDYWLLISGGQYLMTIPLSEINEERRRTLREAFQKAGIKLA